ncbi:hypothetical protein FOLKNPGA_02689 [Legionella sp. PC1000]|uniref:hypothetical protein n=1 Tax=Legionella sp. PC1000 TaxID=2746060 RepID=UPI0015FBD3E5|nr:hypothetical protein [Legionella sp. PC1000]QLZ69889.1 hypothetical protein FOLKNPGA_02689 [Legionella sp. PC1000]
MSQDKQDKTDEKGQFNRTIKGDYNIILKRMDDDSPLDSKSLLELSEKNGHAPILIIQNNQLKIFGYKPRSNVAPGDWHLRTLYFSDNLKDPIIQKAWTQNMIKFSELDPKMQEIIANNHQEIQTRRRRVPTLTDEHIIEDIKKGRSLSPLHKQARQQHFFYEASLRTQKELSYYAVSGGFKVPYVVAIQGTNYKVRSAAKVIAELRSKGKSGPESPSQREHSENRSKVGTHIPACVQKFDPNDNHTLFIPLEGQTKENKIQQSLDMRLGGPLKGLLRSCGNNGQLEAFLGPTEDMIGFYKDRGFDLVEEIWFPSTGRYYSFINKETGDFIITLAGLQSQANLISQLLTLKMAGVNVDKVKVYGDTQSIEHDITQDILNFKEKLLSSGINLEKQNTALVIAGNGGILGREIERLDEDIDVDGQIKSEPGSKCAMTFYPTKGAKGGVVGIINLSMPYGEVMGPMMTDMAEHLHVREVFLAGIGGAIGRREEKLEEDVVEQHIGTYHVFFTTTNPETGARYTLEDTEVIMPPIDQKGKGWLNDESVGLHVHVDSPFIETFGWLEERMDEGCTMVDCESHFAIERIKKWNEDHPEDKIRIMPGLLVSDYVGHKSLGALTPDTCKHVKPFLEHFVERIKEPREELTTSFKVL